MPGLAADFQTLFGFLNSLFGRTLPFLYKDEYDNYVANQAIATGDGVTTTFQLQRTLGGSTDPVFAPIAAGLVVTVAGTPTSVTVTILSGIITFASAPASGAAIAATFSYYWRCFLDDDEGQEFGYFDQNGVEMKKLMFTSCRA